LAEVIPKTRYPIGIRISNGSRVEAGIAIINTKRGGGVRRISGGVRAITEIRKRAGKGSSILRREQITMPANESRRQRESASRSKTTTRSIEAIQI
jgi:hypothetical protein